MTDPVGHSHDVPAPAGPPRPAAEALRLATAYQASRALHAAIRIGLPRQITPISLVLNLVVVEDSECREFSRGACPLLWDGPPLPLGRVSCPSKSEGEEAEMEIAVLGIDLGKNSCSVVGLDGAGRVVLRRRMHRDGVAKLAAGLPACVARWRRAAARTTSAACCAGWATRSG
jgi:hypothetical protein